MGYFMTRGRRAAVMVAALASLSVLAVGPVLADTSITEVGRTGRHRLVDTVTKPGAICEYYNRTHEGSEQYAGLLKYIHVRPPKMFARWPGIQDVGWQFMVLRTRLDDATPSWTKTYTSPLMTASATKTGAAQFSYVRVGVNVPRDGRWGVVQYAYRVQVEMHWYGVHGSGGYVSADSVHQVDVYSADLNGFPGGSQGTVFQADCRGYVSYP